MSKYKINGSGKKVEPEVKRTISGRNIYIDKSGMTVFKDSLTGKCYVIQPKDEQGYYLYHNRFMLIVLVLVLLAGYIEKLSYLALIGGAAFLLAEAWFRFRYLRGLDQVELSEGMKQCRYTLMDAIVSSDSTGKVIAKIVLYCAFSVLIVINAIQTNATKPIMIFSVILSVLALYYVVVHIVGLIKKSKKQV